MAISEHRVTNNISINITNKFLPGWGWYTNASTTAKSRLWVVQNTAKVTFSPQEDSI